MARNLIGLDRAKNISEPDFITQARDNHKSYLVDLVQVFGTDDTVFKIDIRGFDTLLKKNVKIDVKDPDDNNLTTGNYTIPTSEISTLKVWKEDRDQLAEGRMLAFRVCKDGKRTRNFLYVDAYELIEKILDADPEKHQPRGNDDYWLVSEKEIRSLSSCREI